MPSPRCSLVIPLYQEAGNVASVVPTACEVLAQIDPQFEAILVDDGSTDGTGAELTRVAATEARCRVVTLAKNGGQANALLTGLQHARGEILLTMDGDGQNDPHDFPALLALLERRGIDVACGWRFPRHDGFVRGAMSRLANAVRSRVLRDGLHDGGCQLRVMRRAVIGALRPSPLMQSFLPAMAVAAGFRVGELRVRHYPRRHGDSKYSLGNLWWRPFAEMLRLRRVLSRPAAPR